MCIYFDEAAIGKWPSIDSLGYINICFTLVVSSDSFNLGSRGIVPNEYNSYPRLSELSTLSKNPWSRTEV